MDSSSSRHLNNEEDNDQHDEFDGQQEEFHTPDSNQRGKRKQTHEGGGSSEQNKKRILPPRSDVWAHFTRLEKNRDKCICHYCQKEYTCPTKSGTTNLRNHLQICKQYKAWQDGQNPKFSQHVINKEGHMQYAKVSESVFREASNEMLVIGELPLAFIECMAWRHFCQKVMSNDCIFFVCFHLCVSLSTYFCLLINMYIPIWIQVNLPNPHSRRTATRDIVEMYVQRKATLRKWFLANKQRVSLTTNIWVCQVTGNVY